MGFFFDSDYEIMLKNEIKSYRKQTINPCKKTRFIKLFLCEYRGRTVYT